MISASDAENNTCSQEFVTSVQTPRVQEVTEHAQCASDPSPNLSKHSAERDED